MEPLNELQRYLDTIASRLQSCETRPLFGRAPFITISRQAGADGHALAEAVIRSLARRQGTAFEGWKIFDDALFHLLAREPRLKVSMRYLLDEEYHSRMTDYLEQAFAWWSPQDVVLARIFHNARALAGVGKVIIVGRGGACVTSDLSGGVHVRLVASLDRRLAAIRRREDLDEKKGRRRLQELDQARKTLVWAHFHRDIDDPLLYDAVFNEDRLPSGEIAEWIAGEVEKKAALLTQASQRAASTA